MCEMDEKFLDTQASQMKSDNDNSIPDPHLIYDSGMETPTQSEARRGWQGRGNVASLELKFVSQKREISIMPPLDAARLAR